MGAIRTLVTKLVLDANDALKGLKAYDKAWTTVASSVEATATRIEKAAARASASLASVAAGAGSVAMGAGLGARGPAAPRAGGGGSPSARQRKAGPDPLDKAIRAANIGEAGRAGLAAGSQAINAATAALGPLASKSEQAKAKISDLTAQVERNRREMAELRRKTIEAGDADGTLAARSKGLAGAQQDVAISLQKARRELTALNGGLIATIKSTLSAKVAVHALGQAAGNMLSAAVTNTVGGIVSGLKSATSSAMAFESGMADVAKVVDGLKTPTGEVTAEYTKMESKVLELSKTIAGPGAAGFAKIYAAAGEAGIAKADLDQFAESAAKVSVAFGVTADEAGSGMAKMRSGLGLSQDEVESLAGTMNYLSNNMAVTAKQAMEVVLVSGGVGKAANLSGQEVAGLGSAMIAAGAQSDVAATASKNYILALASGETATKRQRAAFSELGMSAEDVAKRFTGSAKERLAVQQELLSKIGALADDKRVSALSNLFGKESLGAISGITGDVDKFTASMNMATDSVAAASSVQNEYNVRSKTSENAVALLKANIEALAIQFGQALLPYINKIVEFLTSPEGQDWGAQAVERAVAVVTSLADGVAAVAGVFFGLIDTLGGATTALGAMGIAALALTGPLGAAAAAGAAIGYGMAKAFSYAKNLILGGADDIGAKMQELVNHAADIRHKEHVAEMDATQQELDADQKAQDTHLATRKKAEDLANQYEANELKKLGSKATDADRMRIGRQASQLRSSVDGNGRLLGGGTAEDRVSALEKYVTDKSGGGAGAGLSGDKRAKFDDYSARVAAGGKLRPSEATEYTKLSKELDEAKATKRGKGHKATKMDKQLAAMDPSLRGMLTRGGEEDAGGDFKVADNVLDRAVFGRATKGRGGGESASIGPGPNITNDNRITNITTTVMQNFPAERGMESRVAAAGRAGGERAAMAVSSTAKQAVNAGGTIR